jgi:CRP-like cAMP-binding protein
MPCTAACSVSSATCCATRWPKTASAGAVTVSLPVSKATIASRLSLTPEYFSRVLHELEAAGLVRIDKRDVHILDVQRQLSPTRSRYQPG